MRKLKLITVCAALALLGACGDTVGKQTVYGAAGGALAADALGGDWRLGALVGSAANVLACDSGEVAC